MPYPRHLLSTVLAGAVVLILPFTALADPTSAPVRDPHGDREPSATEVRTIDGTNVVYAYGDTDNVGETAGWFRPGFDDSRWDDIQVPSSWDLNDNDGWGGYDGADFGKGGSLVDGYAWYRTKVPIPASWRGRHVRLAFLGAFYSANVWVDGDVLRPGSTATIAVRVYRAATYTAYDGTGRAIADDKAPERWWRTTATRRSAATS